MMEKINHENYRCLICGPPAIENLTDGSTCWFLQFRRWLFLSMRDTFDLLVISEAYVYVCICIHLCIHMYEYIFICICTWIHVYMYTYICVYICIHIYIHIHMCRKSERQIWVLIPSLSPLIVFINLGYLYIYIHKFMCIYIYIYIYMYTYIYIYISTCIYIYI